MEKSLKLQKPMTCLLKKDWWESLKRRTITKYLKSEMPFLDFPMFPNAAFSL